MQDKEAPAHGPKTGSQRVRVDVAGQDPAGPGGERGRRERLIRDERDDGNARFGQLGEIFGTGPRIGAGLPHDDIGGRRGVCPILTNDRIAGVRTEQRRQPGPGEGIGGPHEHAEVGHEELLVDRTCHGV